jgi:hypothetical protein
MSLLNIINRAGMPTLWSERMLKEHLSQERAAGHGADFIKIHHLLSTFSAHQELNPEVSK